MCAIAYCAFLIHVSVALRPGKRLYLCSCNTKHVLSDRFEAQIVLIRTCKALEYKIALCVLRRLERASRIIYLFFSLKKENNKETAGKAGTYIHEEGYTLQSTNTNLTNNEHAHECFALVQLSLYKDREMFCERRRRKRRKLDFLGSYTRKERPTPFENLQKVALICVRMEG